MKIICKQDILLLQPKKLTFYQFFYQNLSFIILNKQFKILKQKVNKKRYQKQRKCRHHNMHQHTTTQVYNTHYIQQFHNQTWIYSDNLHTTLYHIDQIPKLQYIKLWATKKIKEMYSIDEDQSQEQELEKQSRSNINKKIITANGNLSFMAHGNNKNQTIIKRRNAVIFSYNQEQNPVKQNQDENYVAKNQQTNSRIMISLKNDVFFKNLSWQQIDYFVSMGKVFETKHQHQLIQCAYENINRFFIIVSGEVYVTNTDLEEIKTFYTGESLCHESFLYSTTSQNSYYAREAGTLLFTLTGEQIKQSLQKLSRERFLFYEKVLMNKEELNYLDMQQREKLIRCFKEKKQIMAGQVVFRGEIQSSIENKEKRFYVVMKGLFSKCKKSATGELIAFKQLREGDYFGEQNLLMLANIDYTVICIEDNSELGYFDKGSLQLVVDDYNRIVQRAKMQVKYISS